MIEMIRLIFLLPVVVFLSCSHKTFNPGWTKEKSPRTFIARFETSKGDFDIEIVRELSPLAADRVYQLVTHKYFDNNLFYRVVSDFVVQFGDLDSMTTSKWEKYKVADEPLLRSNLKGTVSFARTGKDSRGTQLYINLKDNIMLDTLSYEGVTGFPVFGQVVNGMNVVETIYSGYGNEIFEVYDSLANDRRGFLKKFPYLDSIKRAYIIPAKK